VLIVEFEVLMDGVYLIEWCNEVTIKILCMVFLVLVV